MMDWRDPTYLWEQFVNKKRSTCDIAKEHGVFPNTVRRQLVKFGISPRNRSDAQRLNIEANGHPMEGKERSEQDKERISMGLHYFWHASGDNQKKADSLRRRLATYAKRNWDKLTEEEHNEIIAKMHMASNGVARTGSKNENAVARMLADRGYSVIQRSRDFTPGGQFEIDIAIPSLNVAIEWDGATHFLPIYGEERLAEVQEKDARKDETLTGAGWTVIRCRDRSTGYSRAFCMRTVDAILMTIKNGEPKILHVIEAR